nr:MAG TPA: regulatory protein [Caudoviricetes sp.]
MDFVEWLDAQINRYEFTVYQISKKSGVHQTTIKNWLDGTKPQETKAAAVKAAVDALILDKKNLVSNQAAKASFAEKNEKEKPSAISGELVGNLPEDVQKLIQICRETPGLASDLLSVALRIKSASSAQG